MDEIIYEINGSITVDEFIGVLKASGLAARRPVNNLKCIKGMVENADLTVCAKDGQEVIGVARSVTDFSYCCYLSDLAVDKRFQYRGVGRELIRITQGQLGTSCKLILLAAPAAVGYYPKIGFQRHDQAWLLNSQDPVL